MNAKSYFYLLLLFSIGLVACQKGGGGGPPPDFPMDVTIQKPAVTNVEEILTAVGTVEANERVDLKPEAPGQIEKIGFTEGQRVRKGAVLFEMDRAKEEAALVQAQAEEKLAGANRGRALPLAGTKAISQQEIEQLESLEAVKRANRRAIAESLADRQIVAPFNGVIAARMVSQGQYVAAGTTLATLVDDSVMKVNFRVPEKFLGTLKQGQSGRLRISAFPDQVFTGKVDLINPVVDELTRTVLVRLLVPNEKGLLKPGLFARVELVTDTRQNSTVIPESALIASLDSFAVYVASNGVANLTPVQVGVRLPGKVEILKGISPEDEVVTGGTQKIVKNGMKIIDSSKAAPAATNTPAKTEPPKP